MVKHKNTMIKTIQFLNCDNNGFFLHLLVAKTISTTKHVFYTPRLYANLMIFVTIHGENFFNRKIWKKKIYKSIWKCTGKVGGKYFNSDVYCSKECHPS